MTAAARYGIVPAMLGTRILTALILIPLVLAALFLLPRLAKHHDPCEGRKGGQPSWQQISI